MEEMIGKKFLITGMAIEILSDSGDRWETRNMTTKETVMMDKSVLRSAIKLGKAEELTETDQPKP